MPAVVDDVDRSSSWDAVRRAGERHADFTVAVAKQASIHGCRVDVGRAWLPLRHNHARTAGIGTVGACDTLLVWAHCPALVHLSRGDGDDVFSSRWEGALPGSVDKKAALLQ